MASTFCNRYGRRRLRMGSEPPAEEWEQTFGADLLPHLVPAGQPSAARQPLDVTLLPVGAHAALAGGIGRHRLEDLLVLPGAAQAYGRMRRRCLYTPLRVLGVGDRAVALWVQAPPVPGIRASVPFGEIAAIAWEANGTRKQVLITGRTGRLPVRYDAASDVVMDALIRRLRRRAAGDPAPVPGSFTPLPAAAATRIRPGDLEARPRRRDRDIRPVWARRAQDVPARRHPARASHHAFLPVGASPRPGG